MRLLEVTKLATASASFWGCSRWLQCPASSIHTSSASAQRSDERTPRLASGQGSLMRQTGPFAAPRPRLYRLASQY